MKPKEIFDKDEWISGLKEKGFAKKSIDAFHYVGDIVEDVIEMLCDHEDCIEKLEALLKEHKHSCITGKSYQEL